MSLKAIFISLLVLCIAPLFIHSANQFSGNFTTLNVCFFVNRRAEEVPFDFTKGEAAVELALHYVHAFYLPKDIALNVTTVDLGPRCLSGIEDRALHWAMKLRETGVNCHVYIGAGCASSAINLYNYASFVQTPIIGVTASGIGADAEVADYQYLVRISVTHTNTAKALHKFFLLHNYTNINFIGDTGVQFYLDMLRVTQKSLSRMGNRYQYTTRYRVFDSTSPKLGVDIEQTLEQVRATSRGTIVATRAADASALFLFVSHNQGVDRTLSLVVCIFADALETRRIMVAAHKALMTTDDFLFIAVELFESAVWGRFGWQKKDSSDAIALDAFESLMLLSYEPQTPASEQEFERLIKKHSPSYGYTYGPKEKVDPVIGHFYDSIIFYATVILNMTLDGKNITDPSAVSSQLLKGNLSFVSPLNGKVSLDESGDRINSYLLRKFDKETGKFTPSILIPPLEPATFIDDGSWRGRQVYPADMPKCGWRGERAECHADKDFSTDYLVAAIVTPLLVLMIVAIVVYYSARRYLHGQFDPYWWRIFSHELSGKTASSASLTRHVTQQAANLKGPISVNTDLNSRISGTTNSSGMLPKCTRIAYYKGMKVAVQKLAIQKPPHSWLGRELLPLSKLSHQNLQLLYGIEVGEENLCIAYIGELCTKGDLSSVLQSESVCLDDIFKNSLILDIVSGMGFLHSTKIVSHGDLKEATCLIDGRFTLKITGHGLAIFRDPRDFAIPFESDDRDFFELLWRAPEHLRHQMPPKGSQKGDVYSFGILVQQILLKAPPFGQEDSCWGEIAEKVKDIVLEVKHGTVPPLRPRVPVAQCPVFLFDLLQDCWDESPMNRPTFLQIGEVLDHSGQFRKRGLINHLVERMEQYSGNLEQQVEDRTKRFMEEKKRTEDIIFSLLPKSVARALNRGEVVEPETYESTTVMFSRLAGFEKVVNQIRNPIELTFALNTYYMVCDSLIDRFDVYKVEVINDCYMLVSGLPVTNGTAHASIVAKLALDLRHKINERSFVEGVVSLQLRAGAHSGPCVAGMIGIKLPRYCLFGDTVNTASRMETTSEAGRIQISKEMNGLIETHFKTVERGDILVKGKGYMRTYWLYSTNRVTIE